MWGQQLPSYEFLPDALHRPRPKAAGPSDHGLRPLEQNKLFFHGSGLASVQVTKRCQCNSPMNILAPQKSFWGCTFLQSALDGRDSQIIIHNKHCILAPPLLTFPFFNIPIFRDLCHFYITEILYQRKKSEGEKQIVLSMLLSWATALKQHTDLFLKISSFFIRHPINFFLYQLLFTVVIKLHKATERKKRLFLLMIPEGQEFLKAKRHDSKHQAWWLGQEAEVSHPQPKH